MLLSLDLIFAFTTKMIHIQDCSWDVNWTKVLHNGPEFKKSMKLSNF